MTCYSTWLIEPISCVVPEPALRLVLYRSQLVLDEIYYFTEDEIDHGGASYNTPRCSTPLYITVVHSPDTIKLESMALH